MSTPTSHNPTTEPADAVVPDVTWPEALKAWSTIALLSFGGPAGQIAVMHRILVEEKKWISESRFLHALNYCMLLPGPEAQQLATYVGWLLHGTLGGLVAGTLFILPGAAAILLLSIAYVEWADTPFIPALFFGLKAAVIAIVFEAVLRIGKRALKNRFLVVLAAASFTAIYFFAVPFPAIIVAAGLIGFLGGRWRPELFASAGHGSAKNDDVGAAQRPADRRTVDARPSFVGSLRTVAIWSVLWFGPQFILFYVLGRNHVFVEEGLFFSETAVVTFGGAYSVLSYIAQRAVETYGWLQPGEMLDGLGMAETTPGPLIMVVQFVGFLAAYRDPGTLAPLTAGICGAMLTTWVTFVPCFLWIFLGAPYIEYLRRNRSLTHALSAITGAVVGVILNLAIWFALHVAFAQVDERHFGVVRLYVPAWSTINPAACLLGAGAAYLLLVRKWKVPLVLAASTVVGAAWYLAFVAPAAS
jgi:chromate transporter